jgi:hypothetical protein
MTGTLFAVSEVYLPKPWKTLGRTGVRPGLRSAYFPLVNRFSISSQFTTFHQLVMYSGRRF